MGVAAAAGGVTAAQLAATGVFAFRHWGSAAGATGIGSGNLSTVRSLALLLCAAGVVAVLACCAGYAAEAAYLRRPGVDAVPELVAVLLAVGLPWLMGAGQADTTDATSLAGYALLYSLPWAGAIAVSGWLPRPAAVACVTTALGSALLCLVTNAPRDQIANPVLGFGVAALLLAAVLLRRASLAR